MELSASAVAAEEHKLEEEGHEGGELDTSLRLRPTSCRLCLDLQLET